MQTVLHSLVEPLIDHLNLGFVPGLRAELKCLKLMSTVAENRKVPQRTEAPIARRSLSVAVVQQSFVES